MKGKKILTLVSLACGVGVVGATFAAWAVSDQADPFGIKVSPGSLTPSDTTFVTLKYDGAPVSADVSNLAAGKPRLAAKCTLLAETSTTTTYPGKFTVKLTDQTEGTKAVGAAKLIDKLVVDVFEPGSTFKILTMSSALESNNAKLDDHFYCGGSLMVDGQKIKCWKTKGHGSEDLTMGLVNSCNCVFMTLAQRMGVETFYSYLKKFGLGSTTNVQIASESNGILMNSKFVKNVDLARIGFGQAVAVTPLQLLTAISCAVNGGNLITPSIIKEIKSYNTNIDYSFLVIMITIYIVII